MSSLLSLDKPPEFVNEKGVKWWKDEETTVYAQKKNSYGKKLDAVCWFVEEPSGYKTRVLINEKGEILEENQSLEGMYYKIDIFKSLTFNASTT